MNNKLFGALAFVLGAAAGSVVTWKVLDKKYAQLVQEEIEDVKAAYSTKKEMAEESTSTEEQNGNSDTEAYKSVLVEQGYISYSDMKETKGGVERVSGKPYVIRPEEFGEEDYEQVSLTYYADGVLTDEDDDVIENVDEIIGKDSLTHFGEYEDDSVFVRDDEREIDYEILKDMRNYTDVKNKVSPWTEG